MIPAAGAAVGILGGGVVLRHAGGQHVFALQDRRHRGPPGALLPAAAPLHLLPDRCVCLVQGSVRCIISWSTVM